MATKIRRELYLIPTLGEYLEYRHFLTCVDASFNLIEIARNFFIPDSVMANVIFQRFSYLTGTIISITNDIYSFEIEKEIGKINNIVYILKHKYNISDQEALEKATDLLNEELNKLLAAERLMPTYEGEMNEIVQKYI
ncbi:hypothetical protein B4U80_12655, partial [Leptotrombidium deliense]